MAVPGNDMIGAATRVAGNTVYVLNTTGATAETLEPVRLLATDVNGGQVTLDIGATVWFRVAVGASSQLAVSTQGSGFDTVLVVYSMTETAGVPVWSSAALVAANDDQDGPTSALAFVAQPGTVYYVQVGGYEGAAGPLSISFSGLSASGVSILGTENADVLQGLAGQAATIAGLAGDDTYRVTRDATQIVEVNGAGTDTVIVTATAGSYLLNAGAEIEVLRAEAGTAPINIGGNGFSQRIEGNDGPNILSSGGGGGVDTMVGGLGDDVYRVFATGDVIEDTGGFDTVFASGTSYFLYSTAAVEYLSASEQAGTTPIYLVGNGASQVIAGNWGDNILNGRGGDGVALPDTLIGLYGNDTYGVFSQGDVVREVAGQGKMSSMPRPATSCAPGPRSRRWPRSTARRRTATRCAAMSSPRRWSAMRARIRSTGAGAMTRWSGSRARTCSRSPPRPRAATSTRSRTSRPRTGSGSPPTSSPPSPQAGWKRASLFSERPPRTRTTGSSTTRRRGASSTTPTPMVQARRCSSPSSRRAPR
jgi:Ca2+-binding RTX toxin-like protein